MKNITIITLLLLISVNTYAQQTWKPYNSEISFKIKNAGITVTGRFDGLNSLIKFSPDKLSTSTIKASVSVATIKTGIDKRDKDLKKKEYFDADKYKEISLSASKLYRKDSLFAGMFSVTIKGVTKQVEVPFHFVQNGNEATFTTNFHINRRDYNVGGKSMMMADDVAITITVNAKTE